MSRPSHLAPFQAARLGKADECMRIIGDMQERQSLRSFVSGNSALAAVAKKLNAGAGSRSSEDSSFVDASDEDNYTALHCTVPSAPAMRTRQLPGFSHVRGARRNLFFLYDPVHFHPRHAAHQLHPLFSPRHRSQLLLLLPLLPQTRLALCCHLLMACRS